MRIFKKPQPIVDWVTVDQHHLPHIFSQELFFNVCFNILFGKLREQFLVDQDLIDFVYEFLVTWTVIAGASDYATRFNDDDAFHTIWWGGFGAGLVGILMHIKHEIPYSIAALHIWIAMAFFRVAMELPECRSFSLLYGFSLVLVATSAVLIPILDIEDTWISFATVLIQPLVKMFSSSFMNHKDHIPLNIEYHLPKFQGICMVVMGQLVVVAATPPEHGTGPYDAFSFYRDALCAVCLLVSFKLIITDCDTTMVENHAIRRSKNSALVWLCFCQPAVNFCVVMCSAGVSLIHMTNNTGNREGLDRGIQLASSASAGMFSVFLLNQLLHKREQVVADRRDLRYYKALWLCALGLSALACTLAGFFHIDPMPTIAIAALLTAKIGWVCKTAVLKARKTVASVALDLPLRRTSSLPTMSGPPGMIHGVAC